MLATFAVLAALTRPMPCAHALDAPRPAFSRAEQVRTARLIRAVVDATGGSDTFADVLVLVAQRESSLQPGLVHRLPADTQGSAAAWRHTRGLYEGNPFAGDAERWQTYGLFGMNSNYFTQVWDKAADPRILCDAVVDVLVYQRAAQRVLAKMARTGTCAPTWANIHAAVSGGKMCPPPARLADFRRRAARAGIDPEHVATPADIGRGPGRTEQAAALLRLRALTTEPTA